MILQGKVLKKKVVFILLSYDVICYIFSMFLVLPLFANDHHMAFLLACGHVRKTGVSTS